MSSTSGAHLDPNNDEQYNPLTKNFTVPNDTGPSPVPPSVEPFQQETYGPSPFPPEIDPGDQEIANDPVFRRLNETDVKAKSALIFPETLLSDQLGRGHFIMFNINLTRGSKLETEREIVEPDPIGPFPEPTPQERVQDSLNTATQAATPTLQEFGRALGLLDANEAAGRSDRLTTREQTGLRGRTKRIEDSIILYMPDEITAAYGFSYENEDLSTAAALRGAVSGVRGIAGDMLSGRNSEMNPTLARDLAAEAGVSALQMTAKTLDAAPSLVGLSPNASGTARAYTRRVKNPHMEFIFQAVNQRSFSYTFNFAPRTREESKVVRQIIQTFKEHAHPELSVTGKQLIFPSEFDISYYSNMKENLQLNRVLTCALTEMSVNYTAAGIKSFFQAEDPEYGPAPTNVSLSLTFQEIGLLDRDTVKEGF